MDVSVIIVNYNTYKVTNECIESVIEKTKGLNYEIILVDNASTDGSKEFFEHDSRVKYIYSKKNGGFGYGNNLGMRIAKGKYFFLLNSDTLLINNAIKEFYDYAELQDKKCILGCYLKDLSGRLLSSYSYFPAFNIKDALLRLFERREVFPVDCKFAEVQVVSGADMFFHRELFDRTSGFDENIFLYGEEAEWEYRLKRLGYHAYLIPTPQIIHLEAKSSTNKTNRRIPKLKGHFYILKKHMRYSTYLLARLYYAVNILTRNIKHWFDPDYRDYFTILFSPLK